ncbi:MAG: GNAT family N-acetyltransferase [Anaerolineae bacterium]|nr:GNAT family N-acetyltransferase [Anaerolineae bacterium]
MHKLLPDGLILRSLSEGHATDRERLPTFYNTVFNHDEGEHVQTAFGYWIGDLMDGHPTVTDEDIFVVVDPSKDEQIVSATLLIPQVWRYDTVELPVGRPELVATDPAYRNRGLVRALFDAVHERSAALGHNVLGITGIPYFYRQFGYTMTVDLGQYAVYPLASLQDAKPDYVPAFRLRPAVVEDVPQLMTWTAHFARERLLTTVRTADEWRYELANRAPGSTQTVQYHIIINAEGNGVGYLAVMRFRFDREIFNCLAYVVGPESSYLATFEDVMRAVKAWAPGHYGDLPPMMGFGTGIHDALARLIDRTIGGLVRRRVYSWYMRVVDPVRFIHDITPVLEARLENSGAHRYTGDLKIGFYDKTGLTLTFEEGRLTDVVLAPASGNFDISFPWHTFWNVVFGQHTYDDLRNVLPDVWANSKSAVLLDALFPKKQSWIIPIA